MHFRPQRICRVRFRREGIAIVLRDGSQHVTYQWKWLAPIAVVPFLLLTAMIVTNANARWFLTRRPMEFQAAVDELKVDTEVVTKNLLATGPVNAETPVPTVHLAVPKNTLSHMQTALRYGSRGLGRDEGGMFEYFKAVYIDEGESAHECKVSLRGLSSWHHQPEKPSLRVRIKKKDVTNGRRYIELQRPEDVLALKNWLPQVIAREIGLLSDMTEHVRLFINNKYFGVYLRTMRCGEPMAIANNRMPGTFFKGDAGEQHWQSLDFWGISGEKDSHNRVTFERFLRCLRDEPPEAAMSEFGQVIEVEDTIADNAAQLARFLESPWHDSSPEPLLQLRDLLDVEVYAKWSALMIATGSIHTDRLHNHNYFICSNQGKVEAVPWDCNSFGIHCRPNVPVDVLRHPVMERIICDPLWVHRRNEWLHRLLNAQVDTNKLHTRIDEVVDDLLADLKADRHLSSIQYTTRGWVLIPASVVDIEKHRQEMKEWVKQRHAFLSQYLADARVSVQALPGQPAVCEVKVFGTVAVDVDSISGIAPFVEGSAGDTPDRLYPGLSSEVGIFRSAPYESAATFDVYHAKPAPLTYRVHASPQKLAFTNAVTGKQVTATSLSPDNAPVRTVHPSHFGATDRQDIVLGPGDVSINADVNTAPGQCLIIRPGTRLMMAGGVSIHARGPMHANGTTEQPIDIRSSGDAPWGAIGICGTKTAKSVLSHVRMEGGSIGGRGGLQYKGMLSVYDCPDISLVHCNFGRNYDGDDAVNLAESCIRVEDCSWNNAMADALDLDMCNGTLVRCKWVGSGNDGLDLMNCRVSICDSHFERNRDKGLSVGENSHAVVNNCRISACDIGVQAKDSSRVLLTNTTLEHNRIALHAYQKKWEYSRGGDIALDRCTIGGNKEGDCSVEKRCNVISCRTAVSTILTGDDRLMQVSELPAEWSNLLRDIENFACLPIVTN